VSGTLLLRHNKKYINGSLVHYCSAVLICIFAQSPQALLLDYFSFLNAVYTLILIDLFMQLGKWIFTWSSKTGEFIGTVGGFTVILLEWINLDSI
jgi:hypothetical protein